MLRMIRRIRMSYAYLQLIRQISTGLFVYLTVSGIFCGIVLAENILSGANGKIDKEIIQALERGEEVEVVVMLDDTPAMQAQISEPAVIKNEITDIQEDVLANLYPSDYVVRRQYKTIPALAGKITSLAGLQRLVSQTNVVRVDMDIGGTGSLSTSVPLIRANTLHQQGVTGEGVVVAVLDSGIDTDHIDLSDDLIAQACFLDNDGVIDGLGLCPNGSDRQFGPGAAEDGAGHGTFTTGVITSNGTVSSVGVAPDAKIVSIKVLDDSTFSGVFYYFSEIVAALDYIASERTDVKIINMSFGTHSTFTGDCDTSTSYNMAGAAVINTLRQQGVIAFASSGNGGSATHMTSPACLSNVISVGATDNSDAIVGFTSSNESTDVMAPGVGIESSAIGNTVRISSGTSFATAHAAACAALLIDTGIYNSPDEIEERIEKSPLQVDNTRNGLSFPRLDCGSLKPDHYLLYGLNKIYDDGGVKGQVVRLANRFGRGRFKIGKITRLGNPVDKNQHGISFQDIHYLMYRIKRTNKRYKHKRMRVRVSNQFAKKIHLETTRLDRLLVPSALSLDGFINPLKQGRADVLNCYRVKKRARRRRTVELEDEFISDQLGQEKSFYVREPRHLCSPARLRKTGLDSKIIHSKRHLLCYKIKRTRYQPHHQKVWDIDTNNVLGPSVLETRVEKELCVPSKIHSLRVIRKRKKRRRLRKRKYRGNSYYSSRYHISKSSRR